MQAGYPKKYGQGSLNAQKPLNTFVKVKYPENNRPKIERIKIGFMNNTSFTLFLAILVYRGSYIY